MIYQTKEYRCGPAAIVNALKCLGIDKSENHVSRLCNTTAKHGTDESQLREGIALLNCYSDPLHTNNKADAEWWLRDCLFSYAHPVILCVSNYTHWVCAVRGCDDRVLAIDSDVNCRNVQENGVHSLTINQVLHWWRADKKTTTTHEHAYYGIGIYRRERPEL